MTNHSCGNDFDGYADNYDIALAQGISISGEDKKYFARGRVAWLSNCLRDQPKKPECVIDFGCGTGAAVPFLHDLIGAQSVLGIDNSPKLLEVARHAQGSERARFLLINDYRPCEEVDLVFCTGVFHHIPPDERAGTIDYVRRTLRRGGLFALWENNPWNPGTRYVMSRIPFDRDAVPLSAPETRRLMRAGGFEVLRTDFLFIFPNILRWFRCVEPRVSRLPLGAQYQVLGRKLE